jgi:glycosyltransferase involved in cell wall biosynthesis
MTIRVLHVTQPVQAGVDRVVSDYVSALHGHDVKLAIVAPPGPLSTRVAQLGVEWLRWDATRQPGLDVADETRALDRQIRRWAPDLVHLHCAKAGLAGRLAVRGRIPTVFQPHAWSFDAVNGQLQSAALAWERWATRWTDAVVCVSDGERDHGIDHGVRASWVTVPNRVDLDRWRPFDHVEARSRLRLHPDRPIAVCVGRLAPQKGQHDLLNAWGAVRRQVPGAQLVLVGDGPDRPRLEAVADASVLFAGEVASPHEWYAAADLVVVPSRWEGQALVPLEAQASGRVVVATDVTGNAESLAPPARLTRPGDLDDLASAIADVLTDRAQAQRDGQAARAHALTLPGPATLGDELASVYARVSAPASPRHLASGRGRIASTALLLG